MQVERLPDGPAFLRAAERFLLRNEVENGVLGVALRLAREQSSGDAPYFALVRDRGEICGAAVCSRPDIVLITRMPLAACDALGQDLLATREQLREVVGPEPSVGELAGALELRSGRKARRRVATRVHALTRVNLPSALAPGRLRQANRGDLPLLVRWVAAFDAEIGETGDAAAIAHARVASGALFLWENEGAPVAMAAHTRKTPNGIAVQLVYTPPALRGRGYASACVGTLSQALLAQGNRFVCLYTDIENETSNAIYARLGYRPVSDAAHYLLD